MSFEDVSDTGASPVYLSVDFAGVADTNVPAAPTALETFACPANSYSYIVLRVVLDAIFGNTAAEDDAITYTIAIGGTTKSFTDRGKLAPAASQSKHYHDTLEFGAALLAGGNVEIRHSGGDGTAKLRSRVESFIVYGIP